MRTVNRRLLWEHLFAIGPATRPQLARETGLSLPTVNAAVAELEQEQLVRSAGRPESTHGGRPAEIFVANSRAGFVIAVDLGRAWIHIALTDLSGEIVSRSDVRNRARSSALLLELITTASAQVVAEGGIGREEIVHTVIGAPGVFDPARGRVLYAANLPGWQRAGLAKALAGSLSGALTIDNDANLAAIGEHAYGAGRGLAHFVYAHIGTGVGLGLIIDGRLYNGSSGAAGEAGYLPIDGRLYNGFSGAAGEAGYLPIDGSHDLGGTRRGMLEEHLAADAVVRYGRQQGLEATTAEAVFAAARDGDQRAVAAVNLEANYLARLLASVTALLDPQLIVLGGAIGRNLDLLAEPTRAALMEISPLRPAFSVGELGDEAVLRGAIATGVTRAKELVAAHVGVSARP